MKTRLILFSLLVGMLVSSCYDDAAIWDSIKDHESRITKLEILCNQMNTNVSSLQSVVQSLQNHDYVTAVAPVYEKENEIGYTITFASGKSVTIYHGINGNDGNTPDLGVNMDTDGIYYWTLDGEWLTDNSNHKIPTSGDNGQNGITPLFKIEDEFWHISYDNGLSWDKLSKASGECANVTNVSHDSNYVYIQLNDGTILSVPRLSTQEATEVFIKSISEFSATFTGTLKLDSNFDEFGIVISEDSALPLNNSRLITLTEWTDNGSFAVDVENLKSSKQYYYSFYTYVDGAYSIGVVKSFITKPVKFIATTHISEAGTQSAKIVLTWEMSVHDPNVVVGIQYRDSEYQYEWYRIELNGISNSGSYEFTLNDLSINTTYEYTYFYRLGDIEYAGNIEFLNLQPVSADLIGLHVIVDKYVIKADGVDGTKVLLINNGEDVTSDADFYIFKDKGYSPLTLIDGQFRTSSPGTYNITVSYKTQTLEIFIDAIQYDVPNNAVDLYPEKLSFVRRAFLTRYTGTSCGYCPGLMKIIKTLEEDRTIPDKAILAVVHSYNTNDPAYISKPSVSSYPFLTVNSTMGFNYRDGATILNTLIDETLVTDAPVGISANSILYDNTTLVVKVSVKAAQEGNYKAGIWLLEDNIYAIQSDYLYIADESYNVHDNCVRYVDDTCVDRGHCLGTITQGETKETVFVINLDSTWKVENLHFAITVSEADKTGRYYSTCNAIDCAINDSVSFGYK